MTPVTRTTLLVLGLLVLTGAALAPGLSGGFVYDDWWLIVRNEHIREPGSPWAVVSQPFWEVSGMANRGGAAYSGLWRPWVSLTYVVEFSYFEEDPLGYHVVSWLLHLAAVGLAFAFLRRRLPAAPWSGVACALGVALFALHPSRPETVTWVSGSTDLWMALWLLLGMAALAQPRPLLKALGGLCFALAVWSKEAALLVPIVLVTDAWLLEGRRPRLDLEGVAAAGAVGAFVARFLVPVGGSEPLIIGGPDAVPRVLSTIGHFVARTVWPHPPSMEPAVRSLDPRGGEVFEPWSMGLGAAVLLVLASVAVAAWKRPSVRPYLADVLWYFVLLAPVSNLIDRDSTSLVADRFLYLPMLGVGALVARGSLAALRAERVVRHAAVALGAATIVVLAALTSVRATHFTDDQTLWAVELEHNPSSTEARRQAASAAESSGDLDEALRHLIVGAEEARERNASYEAIRFVLDAVRLVLRKTSDAEQGDLERIRAFYDRLAASPEASLTLDELQVSAVLAEHDWEAVRADAEKFVIPRAMSHARTLRLQAAEEQLRSLLRQSSRYPAAWNLLIAVHGRQGEWDDARRAAAAANRHLPASPTISAMTRNLANAEAIARQPAPTEVARAVRDARAQSSLGAPEAARRILDDALADHPWHPRLVIERAKADVADGRFDLARRVLERARDADAGNEARWDAALERLDEARRAGEARP